ncbi:type II toxin-antitoxin system VapC family toxin [Mesorhizobium sp. SB112]|uniref:type II toxin-antitoxin system VapC family toxin n=1 Tax=Mesorhizobium sp. SB112 TaxID=3151853 RepID=UPI003262FC92
MSDRGYLLDTHIFLWDLADDKRISKVHDEILLGDAPKFLSVASLWEIAIKSATGKLSMPDKLLETIEASDVELLPILPRHVLQTTSLPRHHGDPFDRLLIAQAQLEELTLVTADGHFSNYDVTLA